MFLGASCFLKLHIHVHSHFLLTVCLLFQNLLPLPSKVKQDLIYVSTCSYMFLTFLMADFHRYGVSPFEYALGESGGSLQLAIVNAQIKWPAGPKPPYPEALHQFVTWMLQPQAAVRPHIDDIIFHVDKLISKFSN